MITRIRPTDQCAPTGMPRTWPSRTLCFTGPHLHRATAPLCGPSGAEVRGDVPEHRGPLGHASLPRAGPHPLGRAEGRTARAAGTVDGSTSPAGRRNTWAISGGVRHDQAGRIPTRRRPGLSSSAPPSPPAWRHWLWPAALLRAHQAELRKLAALLQEHETVDGDTVYRLVGMPVPKQGSDTTVAPRRAAAASRSVSRGSTSGGGGRSRAGADHDGGPDPARREAGGHGS